ncbi:MAG: ACT domain-containing protein, partial [Muribaculaceae bacterium]|nr:ACT domain-containing protein [Muribaculaceae bacterium]
CTYGAKVIYPPTIYPVFHKNIPIKILNTFHPSAPGTLIYDTETAESFNVKGVSVLRGTSLFSIIPPEGVDRGDTGSRALNALARQGIKMYPVTAFANAGLNFAVSSDDENKALAVIRSEFAPELPENLWLSPVVKSGLSTVAVVGDNLRRQPGLGARIRNSLMRNGVTVNAFSEDMSDSTLTFMVGRDDADKALRVIHSLVVD